MFKRPYCKYLVYSVFNVFCIKVIINVIDNKCEYVIINTILLNMVLFIAFK